MSALLITFKTRLSRFALPQFTSKNDYPAQEVVDGAVAAFSP
jgi:hypothetical protein